MAETTIEGAPSARVRRATLVATSLGFGVVQLDVSVVNVAIRPIGDALGGSVTSLQLVVSAYTVAFAALILSSGSLGDRLGARRVFMAGFALFTLASIACGAAPSLGVLIVARAVQGIGAAVLVPCSLSVLGHAYGEARERARAVGLWALGASAALSAGPLVGGLLIAGFGWRAIFFINVPLGAIGLLLTLRYVRETPRLEARGFDLPGQVAAVVALAALAGATIAGGSAGFAAPGVLAAFAVAVIAAVSFVAVEARSPEPMLPLSLFRSHTFSATTAMGLLLNIGFYGLIFVLSLYFQREQGLSPLATGLAFAPMTAAVMISNAGASWVAERFGPSRTMAAGSVVMAAACAALLGAGADTAYLALVAQLVAIGLGLGLVVPVLTSELLGSVDAGRGGVAAGTLNSSRQAGSVIGVALFGSLAGAGQLVSGLHISLAITVPLALLAALIAVTIPNA